MPSIIEVTVYTLEELKAISEKLYDKAIESVIHDANQYGEWCSWLTSDINERFQDKPGKLEEGNFPFDGGKMHEWDADRGSVVYEFEIDLLAYMQRNKIQNTYKALYKWLGAGYGGNSVGCKVGTHLNRRVDSAPLAEDFDDDIQRALEDEIQMEGQRVYNRLLKQWEAVTNLICQDVNLTTAFITKWVVDEANFRYSREFAIEEASALELKFTARGNVFHAPAPLKTETKQAA